jgi:hypothetical protein
MGSIAGNGRKGTLAIAVAVAALILVGTAGCQKAFLWDNYVGVWTDPGGETDAAGGTVEGLVLTVDENGLITFDIETTYGGYWHVKDSAATWSTDSLVLSATDAEGEPCAFTVNFISDNQATWSMTGEVSWFPVEGTLSR